MSRPWPVKLNIHFNPVLLCKVYASICMCTCGLIKGDNNTYVPVDVCLGQFLSDVVADGPASSLQKGVKIRYLCFEAVSVFPLSIRDVRRETYLLTR